MFIKYFSCIIFITLVASASFAQRPPRQPGMPTPGGGPPQKHDWVKDFDANKDGKIDSTEFQSAIDATFAEFDKNANGTIESTEIQRPPRDGRPMPPMGQGVRSQGPPMGAPIGPPPVPRMMPEGKRILPPFFFADRVADSVVTSKTKFEKVVRGVFNEMDKNGDGFIAQEESRPPRRPGDGQIGPGGPPNARFIAAELRFGDKLITGQPFSAEMIIEDTRRLFDGSTVTKQRKGAIYRDGEGRTRREQQLETVAGFNIVGNDNKPLSLVFINDFAAKTQTFLDLNSKVARTHRLGSQATPFQKGQPDDAKTESLGIKTIEGVKVEGTKTTFEIPIGHIGNDKPIAVVTESWFSPELGVIVMSRHVDPVSGEHIFKLVNIKRGEPSAELFKVPAGFRIESSNPRIEPKNDEK